MNDLFEAASRQNLLFDTVQGQLSVTDLWHLPLTSTRAHIATLDALAIDLNAKLQANGTTSFVKKPTRTNEVLKLKFDIVLRVIEVRQSEAEAAELAAANAEKKQRMLSIIAEKEDQELSAKSIDELKALVATL